MENKVALITGSTQGIGLGVAKAFIEEGNSVIITSRSKGKAENAAIKLGRQAIGVELDVNDYQQFQKVLNIGIHKFGHIDVLVNNAAEIKFHEALTLSVSDWDTLFNTNVKALFFCSQLFANYLVKNKRQGYIVNISSNASKNGFLDQTHYNASKSAVNSITQSLAKEFAPYGINVNAVCPGAVDTEMLSHTMDWVEANGGGEKGIFNKTVESSSNTKAHTPY